MAGERTLPGSAGIVGFWDLGSEFKTDMDENLRKIGFLLQPFFHSIQPSEPGSPTDGDIHLASAAWGGAAQHDIVVRDNGAWVAFTPNEGWEFFDRQTEVVWRFDGAAWIEWHGAAFTAARAAALDGLTSSFTGETIVGLIDSELGSALWQSAPTGAEIVALLDAQLGSTDWQSGGSGGGTPAEDYKVARYWRLANMVNDGNNVPVIAEVELRSTTGGAALAGTATATTENTGNGEAASNVLDGNTGTLWAATDGTNGETWLQIDLGAGNDAAVREIAITARSGSFSDEQTPTEWELWSSDDGEVWDKHGVVISGQYSSSEVKVFDVSHLTAFAASDNASSEGLVAARYWRMADMVGNGSPSMGEVALKPSAGGTALTGTASASSEFNASHSADLALDGDTATKWGANTTNDQWWQIDLGAGVTSAVAEITVTSRSDSAEEQTPYQWTLMSSQDGEVWKVHGEVIDTNGQFTSGGEARTYDVSHMTAQITGGGGGASSDTGAQIVAKLDAELGSTAWQDGDSSLTPPLLKRYWRLANVGDGTRRIAEVQLLDAGGYNVAQDMTASGGNSPANINDGNLNTDWQGPSLSSGTVQFEAGEGNLVNVSAVRLIASATNEGQMVQQFTLEHSDDGSTWTSLTQVTGETGWAAGEARSFDFSSETGSGETPTELAAVLDEFTGNRVWRGDVSLDDLGDVTIDTDALVAGDNGKPLVWDNVAKAFVLGSAGGYESILAGGAELLLTQDMTLVSSVTISDALHNILDYDEIILIADGIQSANGSFLELSDDNGVSAINLLRWDAGGNETSASHTRPFFMSGNSASAFSGHLRLEHHTLAGVPTMVQSMLVSDGGNDARLYGGMADVPARTNAITIVEDGSVNFTGGTLYVVGIKKSRQPLEYVADFSGWTGGDAVERPTLGTKFRSGVIGRVKADGNTVSSLNVTIKDGGGTTVATATIGAGASQADISAAADYTITDEVVIEATDAPNGAANALQIVLRGEIA